MPSRSSSSPDRGGELDRALRELRGISLAELDERARLLKRTDTKYVLEIDALVELLDDLRADHVILEIDGRRTSRYESVYFDTEELRCFQDHVAGRTPRFKARTRLYRDTGECVFEVKLKTADGATDKRQVDHPAGAADTFTEDARRCLADALGSCRLDVPDQPLAPSLRTTFARFTLAPEEGGERTTCDLRIRLERPGGEVAELRDGLVVLETKSASGEGPTDERLRRMGIEPTSLSKYRTGIALTFPGISDADASAAGEQFVTAQAR